MEINLNKIKKVHFIGIGGIGVSAIARLMNLYGKDVSGSDMNSSPITESLKKLGIKISIGQDSKNITPDIDLVVQTIAIPENNPEIIETKKKNIKLATYPQMLSVISKNMKTIAISGTHGKTTTTAMLAKVMTDNKKDPTVIVGSVMKNEGSNLIVGKSEYFLVEACEYKRSFLNLYPKILVITNIDEDHLDYYKDLPDIQSAFIELAKRIPEDGFIVCNLNNPNVKPILNNLKCKIIDYKKYINPNLKLKSPGEHNRENAGAVVAVSQILKIDMDKCKKSLENFDGTWRRFEIKGKTKKGTLIYDDYAHHPKEIAATLSGMKEKYPKQKRVAFFQPHLFSRTKSLLNEFANSFSDVDKIYVLPIYAAREEFNPEINSEMLVEKINNVTNNATYLKSSSEVSNVIEKLDKKTIAIFMGAGDIYKLSESCVI